MGFLRVQTWTVLKDKYEEHEEIMMKILNNVRSRYGMKIRYFQQRHDPIGAVAGFMEFKDDDEFHSFFEKFKNDEKAVTLANMWRDLIDPNSFQTVFWDERAIE